MKGAYIFGKSGSEHAHPRLEDAHGRHKSSVHIPVCSFFQRPPPCPREKKASRGKRSTQGGEEKPSVICSLPNLFCRDSLLFVGTIFYNERACHQTPIQQVRTRCEWGLFAWSAVGMYWWEARKETSACSTSKSLCLDQIGHFPKQVCSENETATVQ